MILPLREVLTNFPVRLSVTDYCNLKCFFCSNEGMGDESRNTVHANTDQVVYLLSVLRGSGLSNLSITGGEPTLHPDLGLIVREANALGFDKRFIHSNGVELTQELLEGGLGEFSKIGVSLHSTNFDVWSRMTGGTIRQWDKLNQNIRLLGESGIGRKVEIKSVPVAGYNLDDASVKGVLDLADKYQFRFKFLQCEPINRDRVRHAAPSEQVLGVLRRVGCVGDGQQTSFRGQGDYLPAVPLRYGSARGVFVAIGCGREDVCKACYKSNETFITPHLEIKPCHASNHSIPLADLINGGDGEGILAAIGSTRDFLHTAPGQNLTYWRENGS